MTHIMIDKETLARTTNCNILSIGACEFDVKTGMVGSRYYASMPFNVPQPGRFIGAETLEWWNDSKRDDARATFNAPTHHVLEEMIQEFHSWLKSFDKVHPWSHGSNFDVAIAEHVFRQLGYEVPWKYSHIRDTRTAISMAGYPKVKRDGHHHHALDDAIHQAKVIGECYKALGIN